MACKPVISAYKNYRCDPSSGQFAKIFLVCQTPQDVLTLVKGGLPITFVNVGNMHFSIGKRQIHKTVSVDQQDTDTFKQLESLGVICEVRRVPDESGERITHLLGNPTTTGEQPC